MYQILQDQVLAGGMLATPCDVGIRVQQGCMFVLYDTANSRWSFG
jgi:hypothetical protein